MPRYSALNSPHAPSPVNTRNSPFYCSCIPLLFSSSISRFFQSLPNRMEIVGYSSGALFALGWWIFIDGIAYTSTRKVQLPVAISFEDFIPGILSTLALIIVNLIDKEALSADDFTFSGAHVASKARACAFAGLTISLGSLAGAFVILILKYTLNGYISGDEGYFGLTIVLQNVLIFVSSMLLWFGRNGDERESFGLY